MRNNSYGKYYNYVLWDDVDDDDDDDVVHLSHECSAVVHCIDLYHIVTIRVSDHHHQHGTIESKLI